MTDPRTHAKAMYESGEYTMRDIAAACAVQMSVIRDWKRLDEWVQTARPVALPQEARDEAVKMFDAGESISAIARTVGVHRRTVGRWLQARPSTSWRCYNHEYPVPVAGGTCPACKATKA